MRENDKLFVIGCLLELLLGSSYLTPLLVALSHFFNEVKKLLFCIINEQNSNRELGFWGLVLFKQFN